MVATFMIFRWLQNRRRAGLTATPFPEEWDRIIDANVRHEKYLTSEQQYLLRRFVQIFVAEKNWEGCNGLVITDEVKVTIAAQVALLTFGRSDLWFDHVMSILVYPDAYVVKEAEHDTTGIVTESGQERLGEAVWQGPVILSWADVLAGGRGESSADNLVLHEFAHQLDMMNGRLVDGIPPLESQAELSRWKSVMQRAYEQLIDDCSARRRTVIDCYGASSDVEFFAVTTEAFFQNSRALRQHHADVYALLHDHFQLDPATWNAE